jgi:NADH-quinone oxidoreductase subunit N
MVSNLYINNTASITNKQILLIVFLGFLLVDFFIVKSEANTLVLLGFSLLAILFLLSSNDWFVLFLSIELLALTLYCLVASSRTTKSVEASIKYFAVGAISTSFLLFGILLIYFANETTSFSSDRIVEGIALHAVAIFVLSAFLLKLGAAPFHQWVPDVYEGSPAIVTLFLAVVVKLAMFLVLASLITSPLLDAMDTCRPFFIIGSVFSIVIGCFGALFQKKIKRLLAYSSINNMGYVLAGLSIGNVGGLQASLTYLFFYSVSLLLLFALILNVKKKDGGFGITYVVDLKYLCANGSIFTPILCAVTLFSFAGIPPLTGFWIKFYILSELIYCKFYIVAALAAFASVVSSFYYVGLVKIIFFEDDTPNFISSHKEISQPMGIGHIAFLCILSISLVVYMVAPGLVDSFFYSLALSLYTPYN